MIRKPGRPRAGQERLTRDRILAAALALVDAEGVEALSMRRLAQALDVDPMALYRHLPDKRAVMAGLVARVFAEFKVPDVPDGSWQEQVRAFARAYLDLARAHPHLVFYVVTDAESGAEAALAAGEALHAALAGAGLEPRAWVHAADLVVDYLNGYALGDVTGRLGQPGERQPLQARLGQLPPDRYPTLHRLYAHLTDRDFAGSFEAGLEMILAGIESRARSHKGEPIHDA